MEGQNKDSGGMVGSVVLEPWPRRRSWWNPPVAHYLGLRLFGGSSYEAVSESALNDFFRSHLVRYIVLSTLKHVLQGTF